MCGRFTLRRDLDSVHRELRVEAAGTAVLWSPRYNIAPTDQVPILLSEDGRRFPIKLRLTAALMLVLIAACSASANDPAQRAESAARRSAADAASTEKAANQALAASEAASRAANVAIS